MFIVEKGAGSEKSTQYASVEELLQYSSIHMGFEHISSPKDSFEYDTETLNKALASTAKLIDKVSFTGRKSSYSQAMQWPRCGASNRCEVCICIPSDEIPKEIVEANIILAALALKGEIDFATREVNPLVKSMKFDNHAIEFVKGARIKSSGTECGGVTTVNANALSSVEHLLECYKTIKKRTRVVFVRS